jgi:hypothetical protein
MAAKNVTLALDERLIREAKHLAVERGTSVSGLLAAYLERMLREEDDYNRAMARAKKRLKKGLELGTGGRCTWTRDELHER